MSKEYIDEEAVKRIEKIVQQESIDNANPSEALEEIKTLRGFNQVELNNDENVNKSLDTINQALLKQQEQNEVIVELCEYYGLDNLYPYDDLDTIEHYLKNARDISSQQRLELLGKLNKLEKENAELRQKAQEPKQYVDELKLVEKKLKALEIIKEKECDVRWLKFCIKGNAEVETYNNGLPEYYEKLTEEEFELLKEVLE